LISSPLKWTESESSKVMRGSSKSSGFQKRITSVLRRGNLILLF